MKTSMHNLLNSHFNFIAILFFFLLASTVLNINCNKDETKKIKIGLVVPLTTGAADFGKWALNGSTLAIEELNEKYKDRNLIFEIIPEDSKMEPKTGLSAFKKLAEIDKVIGVITSGSGVVLSISPEAERYKLVQLNHAAVSPSITGSGKYTFSLVNDANIEAENIANILHSELKIKEIAILYANAEYGVGTKNSVKKYFTTIGGKVIDEVSFTEDFTDIKSQILELKRINPLAVYLIANIKDSGKILKHSHEIGFITQWLSYNAFESPEVIKIAGKSANGVIYTSSNLFDLPNPGDIPKVFLAKYLKKYNSKPNIYSATAFDAVNLLAKSYFIKDKENVRNYLLNMNEYEGASGIIKFRKDGSVNKPVILKTISNEKFVIYKH